MLITMILDPDAYISEEGFFPDGRTNGRTDKVILGVGLLKHLTICTALYKLSYHFEMYCIALRCHFEMHLTTIPTLRPCTGNSFQVLSWKSRLEQPLVLWLSKSIDIEDLIFISVSISSTFPRTENSAEPVHNQ